MGTADSKLKVLDNLIQSINKEHGDGAAMRIANKASIPAIERWNLESLAMSYVFGGGLPKGRIIEIYGAESSGKTSLASYILGQVQKGGGLTAFIDAENALDFEYAETLGLNVSETIIAQPNSGEEALDIAQSLAESGEVSAIVIDSVSALTPKAEIDGTMGDQQIGLQARLMSKACRKLSPILKKNKATLIFINQIRVKIGGFSPVGEATTTSGGKALKFYSSVRIEVKARDRIMDKENHVGMISRITARKNKTAPPTRRYDLKIIFGEGYQTQEEYIDFALSYGVFQKKGPWYYFEDLEGNEIKLQGKVAVGKWLDENPSERERVERLVRQIMNPKFEEDKALDEDADDLPNEEEVVEAVQKEIEKETEEDVGHYEEIDDELPDEGQ